VPKRPETAEQKVCRSKKLLGITIAQLQQQMDSNGGAFEGVAPVRGLGIKVRVFVRMRSEKPESSAMSVVWQTRIDGIDWERRVKDHRGSKHDCSGWHRHVWKPIGKDVHKECLKNFNPAMPHEFIRLGLQVLNVQLSRESEHANGKLFND
jgi:hypothetical protein